jgi:hypothetical protein
MNLLGPLLDTGTLGRTKRDLDDQFTELFSKALHFRAGCFPPDGTRYEIMHYKPGDTFDSNVMEAQGVAGNPIPVPNDGKTRHIKLCVHGLMIAHRVQETLSGLEKIKDLSQAFIVRGNNAGVSVVGGGNVVSEKAIVVLDETSLAA